MKTTFITIILLCVSLFAEAQIRHVRGIKSVEGGYGLSKYGQMYYGSFITYYNTKLYGKYSAFFEQGSDAGVDFISSGVDASFNYTFLKAGEGVYLNGAGGLTLALDQLTKGAEEFTVDPAFKYGVFLGIEVEVFIIDKLVFVTGCNQRYLFNKDFGHNRFYGSAGLRYNF